MKTLKQGGALLIGVAIIVGFRGNFARVGESLKPPSVYWKDCNQPYVMGKAVLSRGNPYARLPSLGEAFLPGARFADHPTPYPPLVALLGVPLAMLPYETAARVWLGGEMFCLMGAVLLLAKTAEARMNVIEIGVLYWVLLVCGPVSNELAQGQFMSGLLLLLSGAWLALRRGHDGTAGFLLGLLISIKIIAWPLLVFLGMRGRFRAVGAATVTIIAAHALALPFVGFSGIVDYYARVGPLNAVLWRPAEGNYSVWGWANRVFSGFGFGLTVSPLWRAPQLASLLTPVLPGACLLFGLWLALRASRFDTAFSLLIGASLLISPVFWNFYLLLAAIPIVVLGRRLAALGWPGGRTALALLLLGLLALPTNTYESMAKAFGHQPPEGPFMVPFGAGLILLTPVVALIGWLWLVWRTDSAMPDE